MMFRRLLVLTLAFCLLASAAPRQAGGERAKSLTPGLLDFLRQGKRLMFVGAHPDDETWAGPLLAQAAEHADVLVVCLTNGEGGVNRLGASENGDLGEMRVKELAAACEVLDVKHSVLGFRNGFNGDFRNPEAGRETPEGAVERWKASGRDPKAVLVKAIRKFRPHVIITFDPVHGFTGHREHRAVGMLVAQAFRESDNWRKYPEQLRRRLKVWPASRLYYVVNRFPELIDRRLLRVDETQIVELVEGSRVSPERDRTYLDIAMEAWAEHKTQNGENAFETVIAHRMRRMIGQTALVLADWIELR